MSYNVTGFTIKKLDNFMLPFNDVAELSEDKPTDVNSVLTFGGFDVEGMEIVGTQEDDRLLVSDLSYYGEFSGHWWDDLEALLVKSTGTLKARVVWECGDSVEMVMIENGVITREEL